MPIWILREDGCTKVGLIEQNSLNKLTEYFPYEIILYYKSNNSRRKKILRILLRVKILLTETNLKSCPFTYDRSSRRPEVMVLLQLTRISYQYMSCTCNVITCWWFVEIPGTQTQSITQSVPSSEMAWVRVARRWQRGALHLHATDSLRCPGCCSARMDPQGLV